MACPNEKVSLLVLVCDLHSFDCCFLRYGPYWRSGDIFGVCLDMDEGTMEYYRNGIALGEAFKDIERGAGIALFPAISLAFNDSVTINFGGSPFRYPVFTYSPLQSKPIKILEKAEFLLKPLVNLSGIISTHKANKSQLNSSPSPSTLYMLLAGQIIGKLTNYINNSYVLEDKVFTYIRSMCVLRFVNFNNLHNILKNTNFLCRSDTDSNIVIYPGLPESTLGTFLTLLWAYLDPKDVRTFIRNFVSFLTSMYREVNEQGFVLIKKKNNIYF